MADQNKKNQQEPDIHQLLKVRREKLAELQNGRTKGTGAGSESASESTPR